MTREATFAWLIEHATSSPAAPMYFDEEHEWQSDPYKAIRFATREKARIYAYLFNVLSVARTAEHSFDASPLAPSEEAHDGR